MNFITNDGVRLAYDDINSAAEKSIVILSGIGGTRVIWQPQIDELVKLGFRVINVDARNQGAAEHTVKGRRMSKHAMDVFELVNALHLKQPYLMGNSMGGATCYAYVSLFGDRDISGIISVDQSPKMINDQNWHYGYKKLKWSNFIDELEKPLGKTTKNGIVQSIFEKVSAAKELHPYDEQLNLPLLIDHAEQDWRDVLASLTCPLLLVSGKDSPLFNSDYVQQVKELSSKITIEVVPESGHLVMAEQPEAFNRAMVKFLK